MTDETLVDAVVNFRSKESSPLLRPDPYHLQMIASYLRSGYSTKYLDGDFVRLLKEALVEGLYRLDTLSRSAGFWDGTNRRPTLGKISDYARHALQHGAGDGWALWALAAVDLLYCSNDFGLPYWQQMHDLGTLDAAWPVNAAFHVSFASGPNTAPALTSFLNETRLCVRAQPALERLRYCGDKKSAQWARFVTGGCPVPLNPSWLTWNDGTVAKLALVMDDECRFADLPILADALEDAGCDNADILTHCRSGSEHVLGCWVVDLVLGKT
jgi:hypothetical protein